MSFRSLHLLISNFKYKLFHSFARSLSKWLLMCFYTHRPPAETSHVRCQMCSFYTSLWPRREMDSPARQKIFNTLGRGRLHKRCCSFSSMMIWLYLHSFLWILPDWCRPPGGRLQTVPRRYTGPARSCLAGFHSPELRAEYTSDFTSHACEHQMSDPHHHASGPSRDRRRTTCYEHFNTPSSQHLVDSEEV